MRHLSIGGTVPATGVVQESFRHGAAYPTPIRRKRQCLFLIIANFVKSGRPKGGDPKVGPRCRKFGTIAGPKLSVW
jgi:hypothetical protein